MIAKVELLRNRVALYRVYHTKKWQELGVLSDHPQTATGVHFVNNASFLTTAGQDRFLRFFSTPENELDDTTVIYP
uniref:Uncharacterized protein n=1 Tax=Romanomermis culicivorax TaxID=13658 RepID=A0A915HQ16_ROMCU